MSADAESGYPAASDERTSAGFGHPHHHHRVIDSTNRLARDLANAGAPHGTVVTADEQTAGRGRMGRSWLALAGKALLLSAILRPLDERHGLLPLAIPLAVCEAAESLAPVECSVKWPNDVWIAGRKVAGILIEARPGDGWAVIGVGLNVAIDEAEFSEEIRGLATSVGHGVTVEAARRAVLARFDRWVGASSTEVLTEFRRRDALAGRRIGWNDSSGVADGISDDGNLVVKTDAGERVALSAGEVHLTVE